MLETGVEGLELYKRTLSFTPRRRRPALWWLLGNLAYDLGCLFDSNEHAEQALALLNERRMNVPWLRVQVLCDQARVFCRNASRFAALAAYETALQECQNLKPEDQYLRIKPLIGLCELLSQQVDSQIQAREYGQQALALCLPDAHEEQATLLFLLAGMKEGEDAVKSYQVALTIAEKPALRGRCLLRLAQLALDTAQMEQAKTCCRQALSLEGLPSECQGKLFQVMSRIQAHAGCWEEAISWALKAAEVWPTPETLMALGQLLEVILEGDSQAAQWPIWRQAYRRVIKH
jgi:tetratricopeptide (TPR) repeat protein